MGEVIKAVVPVAGAGTRLLPVTKSQPKEMLPVGRKPVVQYVVEEIERAGLKHVIFVTGRKKVAIEDHFDHDPELARLLKANGKMDLLAGLSFEENGSSFSYVRQGQPRGLADAILTARHLVGNEDFVVALGDAIIENRGGEELLTKLIRYHQQNAAAATIAVEEVTDDEVSKYGIVTPGATNGSFFRVTGVVEKPSAEEAPSRLAIAARYVFSPEIFEVIAATPPRGNGEVYLTDCIRDLIDREQPVYCVKLPPGSKRHDIGNFESFFRAFIHFALADPDYGPALRSFLPNADPQS